MPVSQIVKIEHDGNPKLVEQFKVYGLPTLLLFKDGKMASRPQADVLRTELGAC